MTIRKYFFQVAAKIAADFPNPYRRSGRIGLEKEETLPTKSRGDMRKCAADRLKLGAFKRLPTSGTPCAAARGRRKPLPS